ncbi:hypothetical protein MBLNU459_g0338t1 [Dothideomycetes sp. NU459]
MSFFGGSSHGGGGHSSSHHSHNHNHASENFFTRPSYARSSSSFFSRAGSSSSHYKRRPRDGYIAYLLAKLRRLVRDLWVYAHRHPVKAFFAVVVPLVSAGGALHGLLRQFGVRLPAMFDGMAGVSSASRTYRGGYYGSSGYGGGGGGAESGFGGGLASLATGAGAMGAAGSLFKIAQAFM